MGIFEDYGDQIIGVSEYWGKRMPVMVMEEAGELSQAISKLMRSLYDSELNVIKDATPQQQTEIGKRTKELIDEIGDMYISLAALQENLKISDRDVIERIEYKLNKKY